MDPKVIPWIILFAPLISAAVILLFGKHGKGFSAATAILASSLCGVLSWWLYFQPEFSDPIRFPWLNFPGILEAPIGLTVDHLCKVMLLVVNTIAPLVFIYSLGYMKHEEGYSRYFAGLSLFLFSMLGIVLADNFVMLFIFWELVGVSSYILIGHYYSKDSAANASKQAFLVNRIGDFGLMLGILMLWLATGSVYFSEIQVSMAAFNGHAAYITIACVLIFCGTIGKSAQMPLHVWLPNSMEGPTPVSSLLHAATMVAAGVYMLARSFPILLAAPPEAREVITWVGGITCFAAALMATQQNDIKRILAYSTISQLGYMVIGIGVADVWDVAMFHLSTHAFFKCLLFLCAGSVIVGMHHEQDIWKMGALKNKMPATFLCLICGGLALAGCPGTSGYFSKDLIITWAFAKNQPVGWLAIVTAGLTAFYIARLFFVVFLGPPRSEEAKKAHESPTVMTAPLLLLSLPALILGLIVAKGGWFFHLGEEPHLPPVAHGILLAMFFIGVIGAWRLYGNAQKDPIYIPLFANRLYIDVGYDWLVKNVQGGFAIACGWTDRWIVDLLIVQLPSKLAWACGFALRFLQLGNIQAYAFFFGAGVVGLLYLLISK